MFYLRPNLPVPERRRMRRSRRRNPNSNAIRYGRRNSCWEQVSMSTVGHRPDSRILTAWSNAMYKSQTPHNAHDSECDDVDGVGVAHSNWRISFTCHRHFWMTLLVIFWRCVSYSNCRLIETLRNYFSFTISERLKNFSRVIAQILSKHSNLLTFLIMTNQWLTPQDVISSHLHLPKSHLCFSWLIQ